MPNLSTKCAGVEVGAAGEQVMLRHLHQTSQRRLTVQTWKLFSGAPLLSGFNTTTAVTWEISTQQRQRAILGVTDVLVMLQQNSSAAHAPQLMITASQMPFNRLGTVLLKNTRILRRAKDKLVLMPMQPPDLPTASILLGLLLQSTSPPSHLRSLIMTGELDEQDTLLPPQN
jgi:hypothetical protein